MKVQNMFEGLASEIYSENPINNRQRFPRYTRHFVGNRSVKHLAKLPATSPLWSVFIETLPLMPRILTMLRVPRNGQPLLESHGCYLRRRGLSVLIIAPAYHAAIGFYPARVYWAGADLLESSGRRRGFPVMVAAPTGYLAIGLHAAGVTSPGAYLPKGAQRRVG